MKKVIFCFATAAMLTGYGCSSTDTNSPATTATSTAETYPTITDAAAVNPTGAGGRETLNEEIANMSDPMFLIDAASSGMMEVQLGQVAAQKANNAQVKQFGQMMVDHHTKANNELKMVASQLNVTLPTALTQTHQAIVDKVMAATGTNFDETYMDAMETAHKMDIAKFQMKSTNAQNNAVKGFASKTLPVLQSHSEMATRLEDQID